MLFNNKIKIKWENDKFSEEENKRSSKFNYQQSKY